MTLTILVLYMGAVVVVGLLGRRLFRGTGEDFFLASRTIGPFVLLMTLFGTHMTAFSLLGASGEAYHRGVGVFSLMASSSAFVVPVVFYFVGIRLWAIGKRNRLLTQVQFFQQRWDSPGLGLFLFAMLTVLLIPYLLIGVMGGGITFEEATQGQIPRWLGSLLICAVVSIYVVAGGVRSTAWANTFQTLVFMSLGAVTMIVVVRRLGGLGHAMASIEPTLLMHGDRISAQELLSYTLLPLSVGMFPHIFMHWLTARRAESFGPSIVAYPVCIAVVWVPSVLLGVLGSTAVPGLEGPAANSLLLRMISQHAPEVLTGLLAAGVFAAIMSSLDSQILSLSTLFTQDIVGRHGLLLRISEGRQVAIGRMCVIALLAATYLLSLVSNRSIFRLGVWSFTGFAALFPLVIAALYWRRSTKLGAWASALTAGVLWIYFFCRSWESSGYSVGGTGFLPVAVMVAASSLALICGSLLSSPPSSAVVARFFPAAAGVAPEELPSDSTRGTPK